MRGDLARRGLVNRNIIPVLIAAALAVIATIILFESKPQGDRRAGVVCNNCNYDVNERPSYTDKLLDPVSMFTLLLVVSTILLWRSTERLAGLVGEQADLAESTAEHQLRAYLTIAAGEAVFQQRVRPQGGPLRFEARPLLLNTGQTPAYNVAYRAVAAILPVPLPKDFDFPLDSERTGSGVLGSKQHYILNAVVPDFVPDEDVPSIAYGDRRALYAWGIATYDDAFGHPRTTKFCVKQIWLLDGRRVTYFEQGHNDAD